MWLPGHAPSFPTPESLLDGLIWTGCTLANIVSYHAEVSVQFRVNQYASINMSKSYSRNPTAMEKLKKLEVVVRYSPAK
jgi:hypothetical protein